MNDSEYYDPLDPDYDGGDLLRRHKEGTPLSLTEYQYLVSYLIRGASDNGVTLHRGPIDGARLELPSADWLINGIIVEYEPTTFDKHLIHYGSWALHRYAIRDEEPGEFPAWGDYVGPCITQEETGK